MDLHRKVIRWILCVRQATDKRHHIFWSGWLQHRGCMHVFSLQEHMVDCCLDFSVRPASPASERRTGTGNFTVCTPETTAKEQRHGRWLKRCTLVILEQRARARVQIASEHEGLVLLQEAVHCHE